MRRLAWGSFTAGRLRRRVPLHGGTLPGMMMARLAWPGQVSRVLALISALTLGGQAAIGADDGIDACKADAMIVFDASGSMATSDYTLKLPRIAQAKQSMAKVIPEVAPLRRLGLIVYGEGEYNDCSSIALRLPPTSNAAEPLLRIIKRINPRGKTPLTRSVQLAAEELHYTERESVVVLITDGEETCGGDPCKMASMLKKAGPGLTIHVIGFRESQAEYFKARCMADQTGGEFVSASTEDELVKALRKTLSCPFVTEMPPRSDPSKIATDTTCGPIPSSDAR
jgi:Ca-activated chloride channel homolog